MDRPKRTTAGKRSIDGAFFHGKETASSSSVMAEATKAAAVDAAKKSKAKRVMLSAAAAAAAVAAAIADDDDDDDDDDVEKEKGSVVGKKAPPPPPAEEEEDDSFLVAAKKSLALPSSGDLIKWEARARFSLTSKDLDSVVYSIEWPQPFHKWNKPMFMYRVGGLKKTCLSKFGSAEGLAASLRKRSISQVKKNAKTQAKRDAEAAEEAEFGPRCKSCKCFVTEKEQDRCYYGCKMCCSDSGEKGCSYHDPSGGWGRRRSRW